MQPPVLADMEAVFGVQKDGAEMAVDIGRFYRHFDPGEDPV